MIDTLEAILPYISGLWTLPWILVGFIVTVTLSKLFGEQKVNKTMKKIGLLLLFIFVPLLLFRIFLGVDFTENEIMFSITCFIIFALMYLLGFGYALSKSKKMKMEKIESRNYIKTVLVSQGRSSAFIGGAMLAIPEWRVYAALYMSIGAIFLFAIVIYILAYLHKKNVKESDKTTEIHALPVYLKIFPWYLICFAVAAIAIHGITGITTNDFGGAGIMFKFFTQLTIPAALYYVGAGIHPNDLKINEMKKLFSFNNIKTSDHFLWIRNIFFLTVIITPILTISLCSILLSLNLVPKEWFAVIVINSILPITSTNMFLVPYGIDKKVTALSITWTTIICVPIVVALIAFFQLIF